MRFYCFFVLMLFFVQTALAQEPKKRDKKKANSEELSLENDTTPNMEYRLASDSVRKAEMLEQRKRRSERKNSKSKDKKIYFGIKTKVLSVRREGADRVIDVAQYIPITHLLDYFNLKAKLKKGAEVLLLHGKFQTIRNGVTQFAGYYYKGLTHDVWKEYDKNNILIEKLTYNMGFSEESRLAYYDAGETKLKEVIPVEHKVLHGDYYRFHENGTVAETGEYMNGEKIGTWTEYHDNRQRKKQTQYVAKYNWHTPEPAFTTMEWDKYGKVTYDRQKDKDKKK
ncbi:MAG: hypothetical protein EAZ95_02265 [Bacteroidetes bacterium]|nr:MAG: hypothetical protein EAZ95_02265 [Bacteroidota bacterium]